MTDLLSRSWWSIALRGVVYLLFGLVALLLPDLTFRTLVLLFGIFSLLDGGLALGGAVRAGRGGERWGALALEGVASGGVGVVVLFWPALSSLALLYLIGAWAVLTGSLELAAAVQLRREIEGEWLLALNAVLSVAFGVAVFAWPAAGALAIVWVLGLYALLFSVSSLTLAWRMRRRIAET